MKLLTILVVVRIFWPSAANRDPSWRYMGEVAAGLADSMPLVFRKKPKHRTKFGISTRTIMITLEHATNLRLLLIIAGDIESNPGPATIKCDHCNYRSKPYNVQRHMQLVHRKRNATQQPDVITKRPRDDVAQDVSFLVRDVVNKVSGLQESALQGRFKVLNIPIFGADPQLELSNRKETIEGYIKDELEEHTGVKTQLVLHVKFYKVLEPDEICIRYFRSFQHGFYRGDDMDVSEMFPHILGHIERFIDNGSQWVIESLMKLELHLARLQPLRGSTYTPLPNELQRKGAIINVQNNDQKCFMWSVLSALYLPNKNPQRVSKYCGYETTLNFDGIDFPVTLQSITRFEQQNNMSINVYGYEDDVYPLRISKHTGKVIHLMLCNGHYCWIKNLGRLLHNQRKDKNHKFFCPRCLIPRTTQKLLDEHLELCGKKDPTRITMPEDTHLRFTNVQRCLRQPLVIYADFECLTEKIASTGPDPEMPFTEPYQKHTPCGYGMVKAYGCCEESKFSGLEVECCKDPVKRFLQSLMTVVVDYHDLALEPMNSFDPTKHTNNTCHICGESIDENKVADHCHVCGKYRGPAHNHCNQNLRLNKDIVVVFHNLRKYDGHLIMQEIGQLAKLQGFEISVVAKAMEDYISFSLIHKNEADGKDGKKDFRYKIRFIDSLQFLNNSLEGLVNNMNKEDFKAMKTEFQDEGLDLLLRKGVYPYSYMNKWSKFDEKELPPKREFFNNLTGQHINEQDYKHAQRVWQHFQIRNLGDYHNLYLMTDVLLLADVFEQFRKSSLQDYALDPCHYMTTPSFSWDSCLKMTKMELELLQDPEMYLFCESGIRGGISQISHRYAKANNPYMTDYDPSKLTSYIMYLDANNLYGWAMVQKLPVDGFKWGENLNREWGEVDADGDKRYILEVDLEYPKELHDYHSDYPLAPEPMEIKLVSPYCESLKDYMQIEIPKCTKLVPNLNDKKKYILHIRNLQLYMRLGLKLLKVHRVLEFNQQAWMEPYIMFNTAKRAQATNSFEKDRCKLMNNSNFGKTMENVRKYKNIELVTSPARFEKLAANPRYQNSCRFNEDLVGVCSIRPSTCLNKPIHNGVIVLDVSKVLMYEFHYDYIIPTYGKKAKLLFTDTDSLCYLIETDDIFDDMKKDTHRFDFSDYPKNHPCYSAENKKVIGKMKDEAGGKIIEEFAGLRPKMYSLLGSDLQKKRAKGIKKTVVNREITHQDYVNTLVSETYMQHQMNLIRSDHHEIFTVKINKRSLSAYDDKRWLINSIESRAHGHYLNS